MFTVSDVARRIKRPDEDIGRAITRVRNWTKEGLLKPVGEANPGTGKAREYSKESLVDALLLDTFIQCFGSSAVSVPFRLHFIRYAFLKPEDRDRFLLIGRTIGREDDYVVAVVAPSQIASKIRSSGCDGYMILNIAAAVKRLELEEKK
jgi:hypothetical protein